MSLVRYTPERVRELASRGIDVVGDGAACDWTALPEQMRRSFHGGQAERMILTGPDALLRYVYLGAPGRLHSEPEPPPCFFVEARSATATLRDLSDPASLAGRLPLSERIQRTVAVKSAWMSERRPVFDGVERIVVPEGRAVVLFYGPMAPQVERRPFGLDIIGAAGGHQLVVHPDVAQQIRTFTRERHPLPQPRLAAKPRLS